MRPPPGTGVFDRDQGERQLALEYLAEAWNYAEDDGVQSAALAHASLFAALATFVKMHGDEATADLIAHVARPHPLRRIQSRSHPAIACQPLANAA